MSEKKFFGMLTEIGEIKEANAMALGVRRKITQMGVCDGNGVEFLPDRKMRELPGLKRRAALNSLIPDAKNPAWVIAEQVIPENEGGFWIRGYGLYDEDGDLVAVANCPPSYKPVLAEGSGKTQTVRMVLMVGSVATYELKIDPAVVLATREFVDSGLAKKLDKDGTAVAASKLATARRLSISGGATAAAEDFDGTDDIALKVTGLDMSKANEGILPTQFGGTGLAGVAAGDMLVGLGATSKEFATRTPEQVLEHIKAAPKHSPTFTGTPTGTTPAVRDRSKRLATTEFVAGNFPMLYSINALPAQDVGPIAVIECGEIWIWTESQYFSGYRSPLCGRPVDGHTVIPLASEVDGVGGLLPKAVYARLWGYAQENGLVVSQSVWAANIGAHYFADVDADNFRAPDLRNRLRRYSGTDVDTAAARTLGTAQRDALQQITANAGFRPIGSGGGAGTGGGVGGAFGYTIRTGAAGASEISLGANQYNADGLTFDASRVARTSSETRPLNTAYHPRIHA